MRLTSKTSRYQSYAYLLISTICWGSLLPVVKWGLSDVTPFRYLFYRFVLAFILSLPILYYYWPKIKQRTVVIGKIVLLEILGTSTALSLIYLGLNLTTSIEANLIGMTTPVLMTLGGILFLKEKEEKNEWIGMGLALLGTLLIIVLPLLTHTFTSQRGSLFGNMLIFLHNIIVTIYFLKAKRIYRSIPKLFVASISFIVGLLTFGFFSFAESSFSLDMLGATIQNDFSSIRVGIVVIYTAVFGSLIGLTAYIKGQSNIEVSEAGLFNYLQPLVSIPLAFLFLKEKIGWTELIAITIIFVGVFIAEFRKR